ncbi:MAG TPA: hypothetical protein VHA82_12110 [Ramlibacter sp.]|nr:hypothetical protein [Ramlibacter sp.]HVZ44546.1 hypothetical protein [Ramlibacter sp.]
MHSLPQPQEAALADEQRTRSGRWKMLAVLLVCAAPVVASYFTYYVLRPEGRKNYGELIEPQRALPRANATTLDGRAVALASLQGQWLLVSVASSSCDAACEKHLYLQRQLREGLGADKDRLDWVWLIPDRGAVRAQLVPALKEATVLRVDADVLAGWLAPAPGHRLEDHLYVVDPRGNWMMRFPAGQDAGTAPKVRRDLGLLMRASASWDPPGR